LLFDNMVPDVLKNGCSYQTAILGNMDHS
jgi:hypothetical protein